MCIRNRGGGGGGGGGAGAGAGGGGGGGGAGNPKKPNPVYHQAPKAYPEAPDPNILNFKP